MEEILSVAATKLHQCVRRHALLHPPAATFSTACLHVTATITLIYARAYLTVQIHSAHNGMMQRKKKKRHKSSVEALGRVFQMFSQHVATSLLGAV